MFGPITPSLLFCAITSAIPSPVPRDFDLTLLSHPFCSSNKRLYIRNKDRSVNIAPFKSPSVPASNLLKNYDLRPSLQEFLCKALTATSVLCCSIRSFCLSFICLLSPNPSLRSDRIISNLQYCRGPPSGCSSKFRLE